MRGERGVAGPFEDIHVLILVVLGMGIFLASSSAAYLAYVGFNESVRLQRDATDALQRILAYEPALHDGVRGLFAVDRLGALNETSVSALVGDYGFRLLLTDGRGSAWLDAASGRPAASTRVALTSVDVWTADTNVWPARLSLTLWRT